MEQIYTLTLAGVKIPCSFRFPETSALLSATFDQKQSNCPSESDGKRMDIPVVRIPDEEWQYYHGKTIEEGPFMEASVLSGFFSEALTSYDRIMIHAVAIRWKARAYLITAPSGIGKSTQADWLQRLRPNEFSVICGDRPILQFCHSKQSDGSATSAAVHSGQQEEQSAPEMIGHEIIVHPSPWNGKEKWQGGEAAPLAGIILLERGEENHLAYLSSKEAGIPVFLQMIHTSRNADLIHCVAGYTTQLLESVPVWRLTSFQVPFSTQLLLESVFCDYNMKNGG